VEGLLETVTDLSKQEVAGYLVGVADAEHFGGDVKERAAADAFEKLKRPQLVPNSTVIEVMK
jgi:hypothetical protein